MVYETVLKQAYKDNAVSSYEDLEKYFETVIEFDKSDKNDEKDSNSITISEEYSKYKVWVLFGKKDDNSQWECLQVAETKKIWSMKLKWTYLFC